MTNQRAQTGGLPPIPKDFAHRRIYRSDRFREPTAIERACGIWVDRVGALHERCEGMQGLRILGLYSFVAAESGVGRLESLAHGRMDLEPGDVAFIRPDDPTWYGPKHREWRQRWVIWGGPEAGRLAAWIGMDQRPLLFPGAADEVRNAQIQLSSLLAFSHPEAVLAREAILRTMIARVFERERHRDVASPVKDAIDLAVRSMTEHLDKPLGLVELSDSVGMNEWRFRRKFRAYTGYPPIRFLVWQRIERAKSLLADGVSIKETAGAVGMPDPFYFMRVFRRETGMTAGSYAAGTAESASNQ